MNQLNLPEFKVISVKENDRDLLFTVQALEPPSKEGFGVSIPQILSVMERDD